MNSKLTAFLFFAIIGFVIAFIISIIAGSSFLGVIFKSFFSALILGTLGFMLFFLLEKYSGLDSERNSETKKESKTDFSHQTESDSKYNVRQNLESSNISDTVSDTIVDNSAEPISYEELFTKLNKDEKEDDIKTENKNEIKYNNLNKSEFQSDDLTKKSIIDEMKKEKERESVEINFSNNVEIVEGDSELNAQSITAEEAAKISATSKMNAIAGEVKGIDDKYIYFNKGAKIENKPEKIAKVIKEMLKNE